MTERLTLDDIRAAEMAIAGRLLRTPAVASPGLEALLGVPVTLKLELLQHTGCFKPRGVLAKIAALGAAERRRGVVTFSGGNHGIAVATTAKRLGIPATVVMPKHVPGASINKVRAQGADLILTEDVAEAYAVSQREEARGLAYLHPFSDPVVIAGQGTVGLEFIADAPDVTDVLISIGGGALLSGSATAIKALRPEVRVWGVETVGAESMTRALKAGRPVEMTPTSIATTLSPPAVSEITLAHVGALAEEVLLVEDADAVRGLLTLAEAAKLWAEPAAGCLIPAAREVIERVGPDARLGLVICGGNVSFADVTGWIERFGL